MFIRKKKGQTTLEYAILIGVVAAALIAMQVYLKRGYQGKLRASADDMGDQFSPELTTYTFTTNSLTNSNEAVGSGTTTTTINNQFSNRYGNEEVDDLADETWW
ncbi:MAG: class III signal peptide-containing protein [Candidatus Omnitrophica bacterium]|nr:class III signal peptide-containing protein [Candidatus Omnitrophota bacterium]